MSKNLVDLLLERKKKKEDCFRNYLKYVQEIKKITKEILKEEVKVFVFGSIIKKGNPSSERHRHNNRF
jgi:hypothetical protein